MSAFQLDFPEPGFARLAFDLPGSKANTLGQAVQAELEAVLDDLERRRDVKGLLFASGKPGMFIAGADLKELGAASDEATNRRVVQRGLDLIARFEKLPYPTVVLIDGSCMGGGLELSLGFDYRLAGSHPKTEIGLPETKIGLIPGWGGTQRLARVIGPFVAAERIAAGESAKADKARELGIVFDAVPSDRLLSEGLRLLKWSAESGDSGEVRRRKQQPVGLSEDQRRFGFAALRAQVLAKTKGKLPAPMAAVEAIERGCNLTLEEGLAVETELFIPLVGSLISRNLIALFFETQRLQKDPGVSDPKAAPRTIERVGVVGAGIMGAGIAGVCIRRGVAAVMTDAAPPAIERGVASIASVMQGGVQAGRMSAGDMQAALGRLTTTALRAAPPPHPQPHSPKGRGEHDAPRSVLADCDLLIEAIVENETAKTQLLTEIAPLLPAHAILASNTSTISITRMAAGTSDPTRFAGLHFFNPVDRMPLVEVVRGKETSDETTATLVAFAKRVGKTPIVVRDGPGFLVNRVLFPYVNEAIALVEEGADFRAVDKAATDFGLPMGPIALCDVVGLDTVLHAGKVIADAFPERSKSHHLLAKLVEAGRLGQKSGFGFYSYAKGPRGMDDSAVEPLLEACRRDSRKIEADEIIDRLLLPMLTESVRILDEGVVRSAADLDMGLILGMGFPNWRGGLLRWADAEGLSALEAKLEKYAPLGQRFVPSETFRTMVREGGRFFPH
ncbi:MAG: enoyl-CoA hydratase/isomerase family protein [Gemmataceae bacterium]|nr:enoyl-CoA hydratase/isomerase family protein [Gemmataceae bacterium]